MGMKGAAEVIENISGGDTCRPGANAAWGRGGSLAGFAWAAAGSGVPG